MNWYMELDNKIFTIFKTKLNKKLKEKYSDLYITDSDINTTQALFPTVYFHVMSGLEMGADLEASEVNAIMYSIQIDVSAKKQSEAREVMSEAASIMKQLRFEIVSMPEFNNQNNVYRQVMRVRRVIGTEDVSSLK